MEDILIKLEEFLDKEEKEQAVMYLLNKLKTREITLFDLYQILSDALNNMNCKPEDKNISIWKEHVKTAIIRTVVECCYPYVLEQRDLLHLPKKGKVAVLCPPGEYHDLGARMVADFFTMSGYQSIFVGSNIPYQDFYHAIRIIKPTVIAISVSNYYNLIAAKKMIDEIKQVLDYPLKVIVGGHAFREEEKINFHMVGADYYAKNFDDILAFAKGEVGV